MVEPHHVYRFGCVFGGKLTLLRWPERTKVSLVAKTLYAIPAKPLDPDEAWKSWFPNVVGQPVEAEHFLVEEQPGDVLDTLSRHLKAII